MNWARLNSVPIIGPDHEDAEFINFPYEHWHVDLRFLPEWFYDSSYGDHPSSTPYARPINTDNVEGAPVWRRLKCRRDWPEYPRERAIWLGPLEKAFAHACLKPGMVCPHRGLPLDGCPVNGGVVVCPGHGLAWHVDTGRLATK